VSKSDIVTKTLSEVNFERRQHSMTHQGRRIYLHDCLDMGFVYIMPDMLVIGPDTWMLLSLDLGLFVRFIDDCLFNQLNLRGLIYRDLTIVPYAHLIRERAKEFNKTEIFPKDVIDDLLVRANALIAKSVSIQNSDDPHMRALFIEERGSLQMQVSAIMKRVHEIESLIDYVTDCVFSG